LARFTPPSRLREIGEVIDIAADSVDARDPARAENVVHPVTKPANIAPQQESRDGELPDFGVVRITDTNEAMTWMVRRASWCTSPEQFEGKKVHGRSDLFSFGVEPLQLLSARRPCAVECTRTLLGNGSHEPSAGRLSVRADFLPSPKAIVDKALQKPANGRYSRGGRRGRVVRAWGHGAAA
jgi:serine/threonine protein kinase